MFSPNHVSVTVVSAKNLTGKGKNGKNDAFVVIQLGNKKFQTSIQRKAVAPYWEEECEFFYENKYSELVLIVYHRNLLGFDEFIGQLRLPLDEVYEPPKSLNPNQRPPSRWFPLKGKSGKNDEQKYRGELEIRLIFSRKQSPLTEDQNGLPFKPPPVVGAATGRNSVDYQSVKEKTSTLPSSGRGLKKKDFMGSMPSLAGMPKLSRPPSPTGSIVSIGKKRSFFSRLKPSSSFHAHQNHQIERQSSSGPSSARNSIVGAPSPPLNNESEFVTHRGSVLGPLSENQSEGVGGTISPEPEDPEPVIRVQKRGGGVFALGGGSKQRPASEVVTSDRSFAVLPSRLTMAFDTGSDNASLAGTSSSILENQPAPNRVHNGTALNDDMSKEELLDVVNQQRSIINRQHVRIKELEDYIDRLLLRVMSTQPELLQNISIEEPRKRSGSALFNAKRGQFSFFARK